VVADLDLGMIETVRSTWQFFRDRRPKPTRSGRPLPRRDAARRVVRTPRRPLPFVASLAARTLEVNVSALPRAAPAQAGVHHPLRQALLRAADEPGSRLDAVLEDSTGKQYLDSSPASSRSTAAREPEINKALHAQIDRLHHVSTVYLIEPMLEFAAEVAASPRGRSRSRSSAIAAPRPSTPRC